MEIPENIVICVRDVIHFGRHITLYFLCVQNHDWQESFKLMEIYMAEKKVNRWLVLLAGFLFNFSLAATGTFSIFVSPLKDLLRESSGDITIAYNIYNIFLAIFGIVQGVIGPRMKARSQMYIGSTFFAAGWIVTGLGKSLTALYIGFGILTGIGAGLLYTFSVVNTSKWFPDKKGFVSGLLLGGIAIGPFFVAPFTTWILSQTSVFQAFIILGTIFGLLMYSVGWLVHVPPENYKPEGWEPSASSVAVSGEDYTWKQMMSTPRFYLLYLAFMFACTPSMMMLGSAATIGQEQAGMTPEIASLAVGLLAVANFFGRLFFGSLSDKIGRYKTLILALLICIAAVLFLSQQTNPVPFIVGMCFIGVSGGAFLVMFPPITSDNFGVKNSGLNYSIMFTAYSIASLVGSQLVAKFKEATGEYTMAFVVAAVLMAVAVAFVFPVMRRSERKS